MDQIKPIKPAIANCYGAKRIFTKKTKENLHFTFLYFDEYIVIVFKNGSF